MTANSFLEYFLVLFGWVMNNAMWSILSNTGLFALPLVVRVLGVCSQSAQVPTHHRD